MVVGKVSGKEHEDGKVNEVESEGAVGYPPNEAHGPVLLRDGDVLAGQQEAEDKSANGDSDFISLQTRALQQMEMVESCPLEEMSFRDVECGCGGGMLESSDYGSQDDSEQANY